MTSSFRDALLRIDFNSLHRARPPRPGARIGHFIRSIARRLRGRLLTRLCTYGNA
ncbi:MAG: hypothetical protein AAFU79_30215 [Myxococcota bacterium]